MFQIHNGRHDRTCVRCARSCTMHVADRHIYIYIYKYRGISSRTRLLASLRSLRSRRSAINAHTVVHTWFIMPLHACMYNLHLWPEHGYVYCLQPAGSAEDVELPTLLNQVATKQPALHSCEVAKLQSCKSSSHLCGFPRKVSSRHFF